MFLFSLTKLTNFYRSELVLLWKSGGGAGGVGGGEGERCGPGGGEPGSGARTTVAINHKR